MKPAMPEVDRAVRSRMKLRDLHEDVITEFVRRVELVHSGYRGKIPWAEVSGLLPSDYDRLEDLPDPGNPAADLEKLCVIKLSGGLGTTMGLDRAKSLIPVKDGMNFLQIMTGQVIRLRDRFQVKVPLIFMNSFSTREDVLREPGIASINAALSLPADFIQNVVPRIHADTLLPIGDGRSPSDWCPPGHGDIFLSLRITGLLDRLIEKGYKALFISNGDNLGATVDGRVLSFFLSKNLDIAMEVTPKSRGDLKGGVLYRRAGEPGRIGLLETAQVAEDHLPDFSDVNRFPYFSINNLWVNPEALRRKLGAGLPLSVIVNPKTVAGTPSLQLETAMGAAMGHFDRTRVVIVPRERFAPVKNCADLLVRRSDAYVLRKDDYALVRARPDLPEPVVTLDDSYGKVQDFDRAFPRIPSVVGASEWTVRGRFMFNVPITIRGKVEFSNRSAEPFSVGGLGKCEFTDEKVER